MSETPLQNLGDFELLEKIGEGGMGAVYRARQGSLDRIVALKILTQRLTSDEKYIHSFLRESRSAARLTHSNIIHVYAAGQADGFYYYAMELVRGETLAQWVAREGALPEETVLGIALCAASALKYAWDKEQIIHRDIKPENIMVDTEGNVKVCDLGLAKSFGETTTLSLSGQVFGTPQYMSLEQARGDRSIDFRSDIYSLGMTLWFALTGEIPFHGGAPAFIMARHISEQLQDPREINPRISPHTVRVLEKMLAKDAAQRYRDWNEVLRDLELARNGQPPQCQPPQGKSTLKRNLAAQPRVKQPAPQNGGAGVPPVDQNVVGTDRWAVRNSEIGAPSGRALPTKSRAPLYIASGIGLLLLAVIIVLAVPHLKPKTQNPSVPPSANPRNAVVNPPPPQPPVQPPVQPPLSGLTLANLAFQQAEGFEKSNATNPDHWQQIASRFRELATRFPDTPEAEKSLAKAQEWETKWRVEINRRNAEAEEKRQQEEAAKLAAEKLEREKRESEQRAKAFTDFQTQLLAQLQQRRYADAEKLAQDKLDDESLAAFHGVIAAWRDAAQAARRFWTAFPNEVKKLKDRELLLSQAAALMNQPPPPSDRKDVRVFIASVTTDSIRFDRRVTGGEVTEGEAHFPKLTTESVLALVDMMGSSSLKADAAWFCFAEQKYPLALARVAPADREKMTRLERDSREIVKQQEIARLLRIAKENDFKDYRGEKFALPALAQLLALDPNHAEAKALQAKISGYYGPSKMNDKNNPWVNSLGMPFVHVPNTGSVDVLFCVWETRVQDYEAFAKATGRQWDKPSFKQEPTHPAVMVSWNDAKEFCKWLTDKERREGRLTAQQEYRLPTEKEWNVAVGATKYPWGDDWPPPRDAGNYDSSLKVDDFPNTSPVGSFKANRFGLFDMGGNVWEWCEDLYQSLGSSRVLQGASWSNYHPVNLAVSYRLYYDPTRRRDDVGFRCVLVAR